MHLLFVIQSVLFEMLLNASMDDIRRERQITEADADGVVDGVHNGRENGQQGPFACFLGAKRTFGVAGFHDDGLDVRHFVNGGDLVLQQVSVLQVPRPSVNHLLGQDLPETHVARADDLTFHGQWIECFSAIVRSPNVGARHQARFNVDIDLGHVGGERIGGSETSSGTFVHAAHGR